MRFPSPANGLEEVASCFCDHCHSAAEATGLDLAAVAQLFERRLVGAETPALVGRQQEPHTWLATLAGSDSLLARFVHFRSESINRLVADAYAEASRLGRQVSLDLFSPGLSAPGRSGLRRARSLCRLGKADDLPGRFGAGGLAPRNSCARRGRNTYARQALPAGF